MINKTKQPIFAQSRTKSFCQIAKGKNMAKISKTISALFVASTLLTACAETVPAENKPIRQAFAAEAATDTTATSNATGDQTEEAEGGELKPLDVILGIAFFALCPFCG